MTLTTHAVVGAASAALVPQYPVLGFALGFGSHFLIDSIPHWNEGDALLKSVGKKGKDSSTRIIRMGWDLVRDVVVVGTDSLIGFILAALIFVGLLNLPLYIVLMGAFAGQLPDGLQFLYFLYKPTCMDGLQHFHSRIQTEYRSLNYLCIELGLMILVTMAVFVLQ